MTVFLITYELVSDTNRGAIAKLLHAFPSWTRLSHNVYAISTSMEADQLYRVLAPVLEFYDRIYVVAVQKPFSGFGVEHVDEWLENHLPPAAR